MGILYDKLIADFDKVHNTNGISGERLAKRLDALSEIGLTEENGSHRPGFSDEEKAAK